MSTRQRNEEDVIKASDALYYEIMMLNKCVKFSETFRNMLDVSQFLENILIESFCVHLRNIVEFFGREKRDYITYKCFIASNRTIAFPHDLDKRYRVKVNNLLSHLTFARLKFGQKDKTWTLAQIAKEVNENLREFFINANRDLLSDKLESYLEGVFGCKGQ